MKNYFVLLLIVLPVSAFSAQPDSFENNNHDLMYLGASLSAIADQLELSARDTIKLANSERNQIIALRQQLADQADNLINNTEQNLQAKIETTKALQNAGPLLRQQAERVRAQAIHRLQQGMQLRYAEWVNNSGPIVMSTEGHKSIDGTMAHNTRIMSSNPSMKSMQTMPETSRSNDMSLELSNGMSQQVPPEIDTTSFALSRDRNYFAHIEVEGENSGMSLNQIQSWRLILSETNGNPVRSAAVIFKGHMPGHVHGLPTQPMLTDEIAPGVYRLSGIKFQMPGWWVIELDVEAELGDNKVNDSIRFNLSL